MFTAVTSGLTLRRSLLLISIFLIVICTKDFGDASSCEVTYIDLDGYIQCRKTEESLSDLNRTLLVLKYKCDGAEDVYEYCPEISGEIDFEIKDCALTPDTFNFCNNYNITIYRKFPGDYKNVVLRNGTFRNHHGVRMITLSGNGIQTVESGAFGCQKNLFMLNMSDNDIEELPDDAFRCLSELHELNIANNRMSVVPKCLKDLSSLRHLNLSGNSITAFPETALHKSAVLSNLDLSRNAIQKFCPAEISQLDDLLNLYLRGNNITSLKNKCFVKQKNLNVLDIGMNVGLVLENDFFAGMGRLTKLYIDGCGLSIGVEGSKMFSHSPKIEVLELQHNRLREIHSELFQNLLELRHLDLSFNAISVLHNGAFAKNVQLEYLDLSNNILSEIKSGEFQGINDLRFLDISNNNITNVAENAFDDLRKLQTLKIFNNNISPMTEHSTFPRYYIKDIFGYIERSPDSMHSFRNLFRNLESLENLYMSNITSSDFELDFLEKNKNITYLDVSFNVRLRLHIDSLDNLKNLRIFISRGTNVESLSELFEYNTELEEINMSLNKIQLISKWHLKTKKLQKLDLSRNNISILANDVFSHFEKIQYINMSHNALEEVDQISLPADGRLDVLDISFNRLSSTQWSHFPIVDNLWASNNNITELFLSDFVRTRFQKVHLEDCKIQTIHLDYTLDWEDYKLDYKLESAHIVRTQFFLARNPVVCDCHAFQLYEHVKHHDANRRFSFEGLTCRRPVELEGRKMENLLPGYFSCEVLIPHNCNFTE